MTLQRPPFTSTRLEEERALDNAETISIKLNREERAELEQDKELLDIGPDGAAVKLLVEIGRKVLRNTFSDRSLRYLVSLKRVRYDGRKSRSRGRIALKVAPKDRRE